MYRFADNVIERSTTTTTGAYQLAGVPSSADPGARTFVAGVGDTNTCDYYAKEIGGTSWERGIGTVADAATDTLTRTTIHTSSNSNNAVDWTGKTVEIEAVLPARRLATDHAGMVENLTITTSRSGNAETIAIKTLAGTDPSPTDPVRIAFNTTTGGFEVVELTAALSFTFSSGSTDGATSGQPFRVWLVVFNDAGTLRLGGVKCALTDGVRGLQDNVLESSTAEGGAGAADSSGVIYTGTAVTSKMMRVLGYLEYTLTTAGTWDAAPSLIRLHARGDKLPGDTVQIRHNPTGEHATTTTSIPLDDTAPQNTEGAEIADTCTIAPSSALNLLEIDTKAFVTNSSANWVMLTLFKDSDSSAMASTAVYLSVASAGDDLQIKYFLLAQTTSSITFKTRFGSTGGTARINGGTARYFGGTTNTVMSVKEIMV